MRVLVCGGRNYMDRERMRAILTAEHLKRGFDLLIQGGAPGADRLAGQWARGSGIHSPQVDALWDHYGKSAGPKRNTAMLLLQPDLVIAFPGERGTLDMMKKAESAGVEVLQVAP